MSDSSERGGKISSEIKPEKRPASGGIPRGIEVLVKKASVDLAFRKLLLEKRASAASEIGLELSAAENAILNSLPRTQIEQIIANTTVPDEHRRVFLGKIAAAMLATLSIGLPGCLFIGGNLPVDRYRMARPSKIITPTTPAEPRVSHDLIRGTETIGCVREGREHLDVHISDNQTNSLIARVSYECPFDHGFVKVLFLNEHGQSASVECRPEQATAIKGKGEVTFAVAGKDLTTTGLLAGLLNTTDQCRGQSAVTLATFLGTPLLQPGEYKGKRDCVICRMVEFHKEWPS